MPRHASTHAAGVVISRLPLDEYVPLYASDKGVATQFNISSTTALRYFDLVEYRCVKLPQVLSIDEFKGNAGGEKYQCILTDPDGRKVMDILPNRFEEDLIRYFKAFPNRSDVKFFVTDMNPHFKTVADRAGDVYQLFEAFPGKLRIKLIFHMISPFCVTVLFDYTTRKTVAQSYSFFSFYFKYLLVFFTKV